MTLARRSSNSLQQWSYSASLARVNRRQIFAWWCHIPPTTAVLWAAPEAGETMTRNHWANGSLSSIHTYVHRKAANVRSRTTQHHNTTAEHTNGPERMVYSYLQPQNGNAISLRQPSAHGLLFPIGGRIANRGHVLFAEQAMLHVGSERQIVVTRSGSDRLRHPVLRLTIGCSRGTRTAVCSTPLFQKSR